MSVSGVELRKVLSWGLWSPVHANITRDSQNLIFIYSAGQINEVRGLSPAARTWAARDQPFV